MNLATIGLTYAHKRMILDAKVPGVEYYSYQNWYNPFIKKVFRTYEVYPPLFQGHIDAYHTFNTIMLTHKPWCVTFETIVPRGRQFYHVNHHDQFDPKKGWYMKKMFEILARDNCKKIIAYTKCNYQLQLKANALFPDLRYALDNKTCYIACPQELFVDKPQNIIPQTVKFFFMGRDFVRKGLPEVITALHIVRKQRHDFELHLITDITHKSNYAFHDFQDTKEDMERVYSIIRESKDWLYLHEPMPYSDCVDMMKSSHVGLLTTWADTLGFSSLDMQAAGLPIITTNVRAQPEVNPCGWMVKLPVNYANEVGLKNKSQKEEVRKDFIAQLVEIFNEILDNKSEIVKKSELSFEYVSKNHSLADYSKKLASIYSTFL